MIDFEKIRRDFPILKRKINGKRLVYLDSGATSQKPEQVIQAIETFYRNHNANIHRGIYTISAEASDMYDGARKKAARLINARSWREIVFTKNATEAINLVAYSWGGANIGENDVILLSEMEHHANLIPWQQLAMRSRAKLRYIPVNRQGYLVLENLDELLEGVKLVAITGMSNVLGTINPVDEIARKAHEVGALILVDGAQSVPHMPVDVRSGNYDFLAFSSHKMCGPTGIGVLYAKEELLRKMPPFLTGGDMINYVDFEKAEWDDIPHKFEAGTPPIAEAYGFGIAVDYLTQIGLSEIRQHEIELTNYALNSLSIVEGVHIMGPMNAVDRGSAVAFTFGDIHPHDLASILDTEGIAIRAGHHCAMPLHKKLQVPASARASMYIYNVKEDIDELIIGLEKARKIFDG